MRPHSWSSLLQRETSARSTSTHRDKSSGSTRTVGSRAWITGGALLTLGIASPGFTQQTQHVITFDHVVVRGQVGLYDRPEIAHLEVPVAPKPAPPPSERDPRQAKPFTELPAVALVSPLALAPGDGTRNPSFEQEGFLVEAFWAVGLGSASPHFKRAHFHPPDLATGFEAQHLGNSDELHGVFMRSLDGRPFGVKSLRYRVTRNRQLPTKPGSIEGFSNYNVNVLIARAFDPRRTIRGQFVSFPVGLAVGSDPTVPWWTLAISGFEMVEQVFIASSASVDFDDIVLTRPER
jgi:hypothetical protein